MRGAVLISVQMELAVRYQCAGNGGKLVRRDLSLSDLTGATVVHIKVYKARGDGLKRDGVIASIGEGMDQFQTI